MKFYVPHHIVDEELYKSVGKKHHNKQTYDPNWADDDVNLISFARSFTIHDTVLKKIGLQIKNDADFAVLEIGAGLGRVTLEYKHQYPNIDYIPIVLREFTFTNEELYRNINNRFEIMSEVELENLPITEFLHYEIKTGIPFLKDNSIDLVISAYTYNVIPRGDLLLIDLWRILKVGGTAVLPELRTIEYDPNGRMKKSGDRLEVLTKTGEHVPFTTLLQSKGYKIKKSAGQTEIIFKENEEPMRPIVQPILKDNHIVAFKEI